MFHVQDKFKQMLFLINLVDHPHTMWVSREDLTRDLMVGTIMAINSSNFGKVKFVKVLNKLGIIYIMASTSQTQMV
jgi:hypothetical protein